MRKSECRGIPSKPVLLTERGALPAQKPDRRESPPGDSADKTTGETWPGESSNEKEKRPRSRRKKVSVPEFFRPSPEIKIPSPEKRIPGLGISRSGPEISRQTARKVKDTDKTLHKSPVLCKKIAQKSAIWAGLRKSRVTKISQNGTICLFSQVFHDILFFVGGAAFLPHNRKIDHRHTNSADMCSKNAAPPTRWPLRRKSGAMGDADFRILGGPQGLSEEIIIAHKIQDSF